MEQRTGNMNLRYGLLALFLLSVNLLQAQMHEPTSATDGEVKLHKERKIFLFGQNKKAKKIKEQSIVTEREWPSSRNPTKVETRGTERQGQSVRKQKRTGDHLKSGKQARVYKRHSAAKKDNSRSRHRGARKHSMARN